LIGSQFPFQLEFKRFGPDLAKANFGGRTLKHHNDACGHSDGWFFGERNHVLHDRVRQLVGVGWSLGALDLFFHPYNLARMDFF
jgi:hypothetical protein